MLTLSNGVEVWLKPTDFRNDQIIFTSYARGGSSLASPADYLNASLATSLVGLAGVGGFTPVDSASCWPARSPTPRHRSRALHARASADRARRSDLETALQLALSRVHRAQSGPGGVRPAQAAARGEPGQPGAEPGCGVRRARPPHQHDGPLHCAAAASSRTCRPRRGPDDGVLPAALRQRRRLHVLLRRRVQGRRGHAAARDLHRLAAVERDGDGEVGDMQLRVPDRRRPRDGQQGAGAAQPDGDDVLRRHRSSTRSKRIACRRRRRCWRCGCATSCARSSAAPTRWASAIATRRREPDTGRPACSSAARRRTWRA